MTARQKKIHAAGLPWFVATENGDVLGYCYLSLYRERCAYRFTLEDSVYIAPSFQGQGIGKLLLSRALAWAEDHGFRQLVAVVGNSENIASLDFTVLRVSVIRVHSNPWGLSTAAGLIP